jgi:hypothetical protein
MSLEFEIFQLMIPLAAGRRRAEHESGHAEG